MQEPKFAVGDAVQAKRRIQGEVSSVMKHITAGSTYYTYCVGGLWYYENELEEKEDDGTARD